MNEESTPMRRVVEVVEGVKLLRSP